MAIELNASKDRRPIQYIIVSKPGDLHELPYKNRKNPVKLKSFYVPVMMNNISRFTTRFSLNLSHLHINLN